jgi:hypothetical protein
MAPSWSWVMSIISTQHSPMKVPTVPASWNAVIVGLPEAMAYRPSSTWTNTLTKQLSRTSQSRTNPAWAPRWVVWINSPVPTIAPARIRPGPICRRICANRVGGNSMASGGSA